MPDISKKKSADFFRAATSRCLSPAFHALPLSCLDILAIEEEQ
ncbi:hypothetical protein [Marinospirillum perlucidum]|nr:hypothetical protein [Marinospirillum perlucidum]